MVGSQDTPRSIFIAEDSLKKLIYRWPHCALEQAVFGVSEGHVWHAMLILQVTNMSLRALGALYASFWPGVEDAPRPTSIHLVDQTLGHY